MLGMVTLMITIGRYVRSTRPDRDASALDAGPVQAEHRLAQAVAVGAVRPMELEVGNHEASSAHSRADIVPGDLAVFAFADGSREVLHGLVAQDVELD